MKKLKTGAKSKKEKIKKRANKIPRTHNPQKERLLQPRKFKSRNKMTSHKSKKRKLSSLKNKCRCQKLHFLWDRCPNPKVLCLLNQIICNKCQCNQICFLQVNLNNNQISHPSHTIQVAKFSINQCHKFILSSKKNPKLRKNHFH